MPLSGQLSGRFSGALVLAEALHRQQVRKVSETPYIAHLLGVASTVLEAGGDEDEAIAALLHDAVEDQGGLATAQKIRDQFGDRVANIVLGCSDNLGDGPKGPWRERKENYIAHMGQTSPSVRLVAMADKLYNLQSMVRDYRQVGDALWERFTGKRDGVLWYYRTLAETFDAAHPLTQELQRAIAILEALMAEN